MLKALSFMGIGFWGVFYIVTEDVSFMGLLVISGFIYLGEILGEIREELKK